MRWQQEIRGQPAVPRLVGADVTPYPYISGFGLAQRIVTFAWPTGGELALLGLRNRRALDVMVATQRLGKPRSTLLRALGLDSTQVGRYWSPDVWSPLDCPGLFERNPRPLRQCLECARHGYHCALFQLPSVSRCPWHDSELTSRCQRCGRTQFARFTEQGELGSCPCGFSALDSRVALAGMRSFPSRDCAGWTEEYLDWAGRERSRRALYVPESVYEWDGAFAALAARALSPLSSDSEERKALLCFDGQGPDPAPESMWCWAHLAGTQDFRLAPLPPTALDLLARVTASVVADVERDDANAPSDQHRDSAPTSALNSDLHDRVTAIPPYGLSGSGHAWLNLAVVDREVTAACGNALEITARRLIGPSDTALSLQASISKSLGGLRGRRHLVDAVLACLCKGYAQGLAVVLQARKQAQAAAASALEVPLIEIEAQGDILDRVSVAWAPSPSARRSPSSPPIIRAAPAKRASAKKKVRAKRRPATRREEGR